MKRIGCCILLGLAACGLARGDDEPAVQEDAAAQQPVRVEEGPVDFQGFDTVPAEEGVRTTDVATRQLIQAALNLPREEKVDVITWRDRVEDALVSLGQGALTLMRLEAERRRGYELSALHVAVFRLAHGPLQRAMPPRALVAGWLEKRHGRGVGAKVTHLAALREAFPHHVFYMIEPRGRPAASGTGVGRMVVAVAGDGRIDALGDDAAIARFLRIELPPVVTEAGRERTAAAAALLALARSVTVYAAQVVGDELTPGGAAATVSAEGQRVRAEVVFDGAGKVAGVNSSGAVGAGRVTTRPATAMPVPEPGVAPQPPE